MIEGYVGLIGGGKSLNATDRATDYMASGGVVCTNMTFMPDPWYNIRYASKMKEFEVPAPNDPSVVIRTIGGIDYAFDSNDVAVCRIDNTPHGERNFRCWANSCGFRNYLKRKKRWEYQEGQYIKLSNDDLQGELHELIPKGTPDKPVLMIIDEAVDFFDTDDRGTANREFLSFLRHSRKQAVDVIFIAQDFTELNKRIRNQTHFIWTFWDMQSFRIPGLRSTLPPPWKNMILCQQWNRNMTGGVLKRIWKPRDTDLFGCYRTDELFRALKSADGKTDFSGEGKITEGEFRMKPLEKIALFACLLLSGLQFFGKGDVAQPTNAAQSSIEGKPAAAGSANQQPGIVSVLYGTFSVADVPGNNFFHLSVDGIEYKPGQMTTAGTVLSATADHIHIRDNLGNDTFIYPRKAVSEPQGYRDVQADRESASQSEIGGQE